MGAVHRLPGDVSGRIAAGEVIEGPFSVVRELLDNSLDAGAGEISVSVRGGGREEIRVADDGTGMSGEDAVLAVQKHTTSKIRNLDDLLSVTTMGFRGEALASVCAVSEFTLLTKRAEDERGIRVSVRFGGEAVSEPAAANTGTDITVKDLFRNLPARRKFLKTDRAEGARVREEVLKKALYFHKTGFSLRSDDRLAFRLLPRSSVLARIGELFGQSLEKHLIPFGNREERFAIEGYVSNRLRTLSNRGGQYVFVNGRPIEDRNLLFAVNAPSRGIVPAGRYVYAFVRIDIDPALLDVNVHPAKREIRIKIERDVAGALGRAVRRALEERFYPIGWEAESSETPAVRAAEREVDSCGCSYGASAYPEGSGMGDGRGEGPPSDGQGAWGWSGAVGNAGAERGADLQARSAGDYGPGESYHRGGAADGDSESPQALHARFTRPLLYQGALPPSEELSFKGTLFGTYSLFEGKTALVILDQHAAHERILYERLRESGGGSGVAKSLLVPINITPPRALYGELLENIGALGEAGFEVEPFGDDSVNVRAVPAFIPDDFEEEAVALLIEELGAGSPVFRGDELRERFLKLAACRSAIKEGDVIGREEAFRLLEDLRSAKIPYVCPHGRPTCYLMAREGIEKAFRRR